MRACACGALLPLPCCSVVCCCKASSNWFHKGGIALVTHAGTRAVACVVTVHTAAVALATPNTSRHRSYSMRW